MNRPSRLVSVAGIALALVTCRDAFAPGERLSGRIAVAPILPAASEMAQFGLTIDAVRFVVVRLPSDSLADTTLALPPGATELALDLRVPLLASPESLNVSVQALSGTLPLFEGTLRVQVPDTVVPEIQVTNYVGPVADSIVIQPRDPFLQTSDSLRFQVEGFNAGLPVTQFYVAWSSDDPAGAPISHFGVLRAPGARGSARIRARTPNGAADSVTARFVPPPTQLVLVAGTGQTDTVGNALPTPLEVEVRAADGLGVGGVAVRFRTVAGGGVVADTVVVTDTLGRARTTATLGGTIGAQTFEASVAGLGGSPVLFGVLAIAGPPVQILASGGDAQLAVVGTAVGTRPSVLLRDAGGNPVAGAAVTFNVISGGGSVTGGSLTTDAGGVATVGSWTLGTVAGTNTLRATVSGLNRTFTATGVADAAAQLVVVAGNLQSAVVGTTLTTDPAVRVQDQFGNPVAGASVTFVVGGGGGSVTGASQLTNAAGVATVGAWTLGTVTGTNSLAATLAGVTPATFTATALSGAASAIARIVGDLQQAVVNSAVGVAPQVRVTDQFGNPVPGATVTFTASAGGGSVTGGTQTTDAGGAATVGAWTLGTAVGLNELTATGGGNSTTFSASALAGLPSQVANLTGDNQTAIVNALVPVAPAVIVRDQFNNPVPGVSVTFTPSGGGVVTGGSATTDSGGVAAVGSWQLDTLAGTNSLTATSGSLTARFAATGLAGAAAQVIKTAGDTLSAIVGTPLGTSPTVRVLDQFGNPVAGFGVNFAVSAGGGSLGGTQPLTNASGFATSAPWTLGTLVGLNELTATAGSLSAVFTATGLVDAPSQLQKVAGDSQTAIVNTAVPVVPVVRLTDQYGNPIAGDTVSFGVLVDGGSVNSPLAITDSSGLATPGSWVLTNFVTTNLLEAAVPGLAALRFTAFTVPDAATQLLRASIDTQTALIGQAVSVPPTVEVRDTFFNPVPGVVVRFTAVLGSGSVVPDSVLTDAAGVGRVTTWTLGPLVGLNTVEASAPGLSGSPITFSANGITTTAASMALDTGDAQSGVVARALAAPYTVRVLDGSGAPVQGVQVRWAAEQAGGAMSDATSLTDLNGIASSTHVLGQAAGPQTATASVSGLTGSPVRFTATALADTAFQILAVAGDGQTAAAGTSVPVAPSVRVTDIFGNPITGMTVTFVPAAGSVTGGTALTDANGVATVGSWRIGTVAGTDSLATSAGSLTPLVFNATVTAAAASALTLLDGDGQTGLVGQALANPYRVTVTDAFGNAVPGVSVSWSIDARSSGSIFPTSVLTDSSGVAAATHTLGTSTGAYGAFATVAGRPDTVTFVSTAVAGAAAALVKQAGDSQSAVVNTVVAISPTVKVTDQFGAPVSGHTVSWAVASGGGFLTGSSAVLTDTAGIATAPLWTLGTAAGTNSITATAPGLSGSPVTFTATALADAPIQIVIKEGNSQSAAVGTPVAIRPAVIVRDQFNNPVPALAVSFVVAGGGGSVTGATPLTNLQGVAAVGSWTLGTTAGTNSLRASVTGVQPVTFFATGTAGAAAQVAFLSEPVRALAGDTIEGVQVAIQDQYGNIVFGAQDLVSVGLGASGNAAAKLVGTTDVAAVNGVAGFGDLAIDSAGVGYTLVAGVIAKPLAGAETQPFDVGGVIGAVLGDRLGPISAAFDPVTGFVYVPGATGNSLAVLDPGKGTLTNVAQLPATPFAIALNAITRRIYVTTLEGLAVFDARDHSLITVVQVGLNPRGVTVDEETDRVFVSVLGDSLKGELPSVVPIDGKDLTAGPPIFFPEGSAGAAGLAFSPLDRMLYVAVPNGGVAVIDPQGQGPVAFISIVGKDGAAGTYGVVVDGRTNLVYATNRIEGTLSVIDPGRFEEVLRLPVGRLPEGLGVDADRGAVYVGNSGDGTVSFIDAGKLAVIATLTVGPTPKAVALDPASGRFYVPTQSDDQIRVVQP